jgi:hypothetical protein
MPLMPVYGPVNMTGLIIARNGFSKSQRAALAAAIASGEVSLSELTLKQLAKVCSVSSRYATQAKALSPAERMAMLRGEIDFADLAPGEAELERVIGRAGNESAWQVICRRLDELSNEPAEQADLFDDVEPDVLNGLD